MSEPRPVDLQLVLAIDSSSSVSMDEYYLQIEGYAQAFRNPKLHKAIADGARGAIAVVLFEWSGESQQAINLDWRVLDTESAIVAYADELSAAPRLIVGGQTAIGSAIEFARKLFNPPIVEGGRKVIDVSGDGASNRGPPVVIARDLAIIDGATINGLAIVNEEPDLSDYYRSFVAGGSGAFVMTARDYVDFADIILNKLVREITNVAKASSVD